MDKLSYALGLNIGHQLSQMGAKGLNIDDFAQAIKDVIAGNTPQLADAEAQTIYRSSSRTWRRSSVQHRLRPSRL